MFVGRDGPLPIPHSCHSLLGYLITHRRRPVFRRELAETLWPDHDGNHARRCLSTALWRVKKATNGSTSLLAFPSAEEVSFAWNASRWVDSIALELRLQPLLRLNPASLTSEQLGRLQRGVHLYRGDYLIGTDDEWAWVERQRLRNMYFDGLYHLTLAYTALCDWTRVLEWGRRLSEEEPLREDVQRLLMRAYVSTGNRAKAVAQYRQCRRILQTELAVEPMAETRALYHELIRSNSIGRPDQSTSVPPSLAHLRRRIARVQRVLASSQYQLNEAIVSLGQADRSKDSD